VLPPVAGVPDALARQRIRGLLKTYLAVARVVEEPPASAATSRPVDEKEAPVAPAVAPSIAQGKRNQRLCRLQALAKDAEALALGPLVESWPATHRHLTVLVVFTNASAWAVTPTGGAAVAVPPRLRVLGCRIWE
jgi:hypothetical protein